MIKIGLDEESVMGDIKMISDTKEEYIEWSDKIIDITNLCEKNINCYIMSIGKQNDIDSITSEEESNIFNIITRALDDMHEVCEEYIENHKEIVFVMDYDFENMALTIEHALYVPEDRVLH